MPSAMRTEGPAPSPRPGVLRSVQLARFPLLIPSFWLDSMKKSSRDPFLVATLAAFALALRLYRLDWGLPGIFEEAVPFWRAWDIWGWGHGRHFDLNPHFFTYPSLVVYLHVLGQALLYLALSLTGRIHSALDFRILYELDKTPFIIAGRSITAIIGAATVVPIYSLARRAGGPAAAIPAALLVALNPFLIARSQVIEVDMPLTFFVAMTCLCAVRIFETVTPSRAVVAGLMAGLATSSKYPGLMALMPACIAIVLAGRAKPAPAAAEALAAPAAGIPQAPRRAARRSGASSAGTAAQLRPRASDPSAGVQMAAVLGAFLLALLVTSPFVFIDARSAWRELSMAGEHMRLGHLGDEAGRAWLPYARDWISRMMGPTLGLASAAGLFYFVGFRRARWAIVVGGFFVPFAAVVGSWSRVADSYVMPLVPLGTVFAAALAAEGAQRGMARRASWRAAALAIATLAFAAPLVIGYRAYLGTLEGDTRARAKAWIESQLPSGSFIATEMYGPDLLSARTILGWDEDLKDGLRRANYQPRVYAIEYIALIAMAPEQSARFYDLALYEPADYVVVTGAVRDRYRMDPLRFAPQLAFYDSLRARWPMVQEFPASGTGSAIAIYRNPSHDRPFASRVPGPLPRLEIAKSSRLTGEEQAFYYNLGLNYEFWGFSNHAIAAYSEGLRYPSNRPERYAVMARRLAECLVRQKRVADAMAFLESAAQRAPTRAEAASLRAARAEIAARGRP